MILSRQRPKVALLASFGLGILAFAMTPKAVGYQELAALVGPAVRRCIEELGIRLVSYAGLVPIG